jgi:hypothetical protein
LTARPNRSQEVLEFLTGYYEVTNRDEKLGFISLSLWLCKPMGSASVPMDGLRFTARKDGETREIKPERLDVSGDRASKKNAILGMRLPRRGSGSARSRSGRTAASRSRASRTSASRCVPRAVRRLARDPRKRRFCDPEAIRVAQPVRKEGVEFSTLLSNQAR